MPEPEDTWWREFGELGVVKVRQGIVAQYWSEPKTKMAEQWLAQHQAAESSASSERTIALAREANSLASEANKVARDAAASASLSAEAARTNNIIATLALIAAIVAIAISVIGLFLKK